MIDMAAASKPYRLPPGEIATRQVGDGSHAHQLHVAIELAAHAGEGALDPGLAGGGERVEVEPAARDRLRAKAPLG